MDDVALFSQAIDNFEQGYYEQAKQDVQGLLRRWGGEKEEGCLSFCYEEV